MKKILVLNHTRMGDLIQTTPLLAGLKKKYPGCEITLLGNVKFADVCEHTPNIDKLKILDVQQFIPQDGNETRIIDVYRYLDTLVDELKAPGFDILVNLSHSRFSAALSRLLDIPEVHGFYSSDEGYRIINDPWLVYFAAFLAFRKYNSFNLVDLYQLGGGVVPSGKKVLLEEKGDGKSIAPLLEKLGISEGDRVIGIQAGASLKDRRWPPEKFAKAADLVASERGAKVLLFGATSEKELGGQISSMMKEKNINVVGETTLAELIGLVRRCELLITNDTGTMHIAAATGTKIVGLFLVHAFAPETGPYSEGNIILQPDMECFPCYHNTTCPHYACLEKITPEEVAQASRMIEELQDRPDLNIDAATFPEKVVVASHFDEANFIWFRPLKKCEPQSHNILALMYRYFFISQAVGGLKDNYWLEKLNKNYLAWTPEKAEEWTGKVQERFRKLANAASRGLKLISDTEAHLKKGKIEKVKEKGEEIVAVDREIDILGHAHAELRPLTRLFELGKENLVDKDIGIMLAKTKVLYKGILLGTAGMIRIIGVWGDNSRKNNSMETAKGSL